MKRYITASVKFSTIDEICNAVRNEFDGYISNEEYLRGTKQYKFSISPNYGEGLSIVAGSVDTSGRIPGALYSSSRADAYPCTFQIMNVDENMLLLDAFYDADFREACSYQNAQWGTYKVIIHNYSELSRARNIFEKFVRNELYYAGG